MFMQKKEIEVLLSTLCVNVRLLPRGHVQIMWTIGSARRSEGRNMQLLTAENHRNNTEALQV